ncbi:MAG: NADPH-dependent 7-cyano-7-deazaguanine reductase QueF [Oceanospirillaceae bacterium]|nr:NADPH-dependent 7-cyano-7-deazaguanine reductase QueF [Oceanospirillaceae bacterium]
MIDKEQASKEQDKLESSPLGNHTAYVNKYDASLLYPIERNINWQKRSVDRAQLPFMLHSGAVDIWNGYEISWLDTKGKPIVRVAQFTFSAHSEYIVESKSFKLYLNSYNLSEFSSQGDVITQMQQDLSAASGAAVTVIFHHLDELPAPEQFSGRCIDDCDVQISQYSPNAKLLSADASSEVQEQLYSHILKSNCPVTGQPDWASISIDYKGPKISESSLLCYLVSYREHGDFHEQCVENIFMDIWQQCKPAQLTVYARYIRRGGLDINPFRSSVSGVAKNIRLSRQ